MPGASYQFEAIGTQWSIETPSPLTETLKLSIHACINDFDLTYSRFNTDSVVSQMALKGKGTFPESITPLLNTYAKLDQATDGKVNPLVGRALEQLGYDAEYSLVQKESPTSVLPFASLSRKDVTLSVTDPALLDIGAIGKGFLIDEVSKILAQSFDSFVVDGSGDLAVYGDTPQTIGLEDPRDTSRIIGSVSITNKSLCASATNRRAWGDGLHHIIDATTGLPAKTEVIATWAIADTTLIADALTTALFFTPPETLKPDFGNFHYVILNKDGSVLHNISEIGILYT